MSNHGSRTYKNDVECLVQEGRVVPSLFLPFVCVILPCPLLLVSGLGNELCNAQPLTHMHLDLGYNHIGPLGVGSLFRLMGQYKKLQSFYLNVCANQKWGTQNELAKPFYIQELATTLCSIQLDFQDIGLVDHSVIDLVNTLVNKWNPQVLQQSNTSALLSLNLLYRYMCIAGASKLLFR